MAGIDTRIHVDGVDELIHKLQRGFAGATRATPMQRLEERVRARLEHYPPEPASSTYERTGDLGRGWTNGLVAADALGTNQFVDQVSIELRNDVSYASWVQSPEHQARVHQGRWETTQQIVDAETPAFLGDLGQSIEEAMA